MFHVKHREAKASLFFCKFCDFSEVGSELYKVQNKRRSYSGN